MKKLEVIKNTNNKTITIDQIDFRKHLVVYGDFDEILCKCQEGYIFVCPGILGTDDKPATGGFENTLEDVFKTYGNDITVYEI